MSERFGNLVEGLTDAIATLPAQHLVGRFQSSNHMEPSK